MGESNAILEETERRPGCLPRPHELMNKERNDGMGGREGGGLTNRSALATGGGGDGGDCASTHNFYLSLVRRRRSTSRFDETREISGKKKRARRDVGERANERGSVSEKYTGNSRRAREQG